MDSLPPDVDLSTIPVVPPPPGVTSNFVDPPSMSWAPRLSVYMTFPPMFLVACLRLFVRLRSRQIGADDYTLVFAVVCAIAYNALLLSVFLDDSIGRHGWDTPVSAYDTSYFKSNFASICVYNITAVFTKSSLLALFLRIFRPSRPAKTMIWAGIAVIVLFYMIVTIAAMIYIIPRPGDGGWGSKEASARAAKPAGQLLAAVGVGGTVTDFYVLLVPLYFVSKIFMPLHKKIGVGCLFLTGLIPCVCSAVGAAFRFQFLSAASGIDGTWVGTQMQALGITEINIGILCGCIPVAFALFKATYRWIEASLVSFRGLFTYIRSRASGKPESSSDTGNTPPNLPENIPRGILTGLRSFMQNGPSSQSTKAEQLGTDGSVSSYVELQSVDYDTFGRV